jgi:hypothetical protein
MLQESELPMSERAPTGYAQPTEDMKGRCVSCGFLAKHSAPGKGLTTYFEVEASERASGEVFAHAPEAFGGPMVTAPICFLSAFALAQEVIHEQDSAGVSGQDAAQRVFLRIGTVSSGFPTGLDSRRNNTLAA